MRKTLDTIQRFVRATFFGYTSMLVLLGAGVVERNPDALTIAVLVVVALNFHIFGYVHNDVVDLAVDRTAPLRAADPLVNGTIDPSHALIFAGLQIPISFAVASIVHPSAWAYGALLVGYCATVIYNTYGKRCRFPVLTDAVQGVAWISIALFGSLVAGEPNMLSLAIAAFGFGFIFLINGVHGGLRDLRNDLAHGRKTTAIFFGARPIDTAHVRSTRALQCFAAVPLAIMIGPLGAVLLGGRLGYSAPMGTAVLASLAVVAAVAAWLCWQVVRDEQSDRARKKAVYGSAFFLLLGPLVVFTPMLSPSLGATTAACFFLPMAIFQDRLAQFRELLEAWRARRTDKSPSARAPAR
jgi:4-hydroxybenzoate polyprenyltransferase